MARWYLPIYCYGRAQMRVEQLSRYVQQNQLFDLIPVAFVERKPKNQFYLVIAINSEPKSRIPDELQSFVRQLGHPLPQGVEREEIERMVSGPINPHDYARRIAYRTMQELAQDDPFDLSVASSIQRENTSYKVKIRSEQYDKLLYWLSAIGHGTWQTFKNTCKSLGLDDSGVEAKRILRRLRILGHMEISHNGLHWSICPPCLVAVKTEPTYEYILAGQRSPQLLEDIKNLGYVDFDSNEQPDGCAPRAVHLQMNSEEVLDRLLTGLGNGYSLTYGGIASCKLMEILPNLDGWLEHFAPVGQFVIALYDVEHFVDGTFVPCVFQGETGMYRLQHRDSKDQARQILFYDQDSNRWVQGDWYGLRFLSLRRAKEECKAIYHVDSHRLAISINQRWPELYERALVLSSGQLPEQRDNWLFFSNVSREVAQQLAAKLTVIYEEAW